MPSSSLREIRADDNPTPEIIDLDMERRRRMSKEDVEKEIGRLWEKAIEANKRYQMIRRSHLTVVR